MEKISERDGKIVENKASLDCDLHLGFLHYRRHLDNLDNQFKRSHYAAAYMNGEKV